MARNPDMERRLINWARWMDGAGNVGLGYGSGSIWDRVKVDCSPNRHSVIPTNAVEAEQTDRAIKSLPSELVETVHAHYLGRGTTVAAMAELLGCSVSTVHWRIKDAHRRLAVWIGDHERAAEAKRAEVARVVEVARQHQPAASVVLPATGGKAYRAVPRKNGKVIITRALAQQTDKDRK